MNAIKAFCAFIYILGGVGDRVVALIGGFKILLDDLVGHPGAFAGCLATVIDAIEMEMDADAIREGIGWVVRGSQGNPPDGRKVCGNQANQGDKG